MESASNLVGSKNPSIFNSAEFAEYSRRLIGLRYSASILGDHSEGDPPVPIPNTEVKPLSPDGTARASVWESRKSPGSS